MIAGESCISGGDNIIKNIKAYISKSTNPYHNLSIEEYLLKYVKEDECIMYLWQNENTVVVGRNQNCWNECNVNQLERDGGFLARRLSGGGAVYHDLGNLNFTFLVDKSNYDVERQLEVIRRCIEAYGLQVEKSGRNDLMINERKFSGNAFYEMKGKCYHHGTILIQSKIEKMERYLTVSRDKLQSKGVRSVRSRVCNLAELVEKIEIEELKERLIHEFEKVYCHKVEMISEDLIDWEDISKMEAYNRSWEWRCGRKIPFTHTFSKRYSWGNLEYQIQVNEGIIKEAFLYSDSMEYRLYILGKGLKGCPYQQKAVINVLTVFMEEMDLPQYMIEDIIDFVKENLT